MRISYITITWTQYTPTMRPTGFLIGCRVVKVTPNPSPPSPPSPQGEVTRRHLTLSAFGYSWWACTAANEQSHQTLMCKSNKCAEVQRAAWILIAKPQVSRSQAPPPPPLSLSLFKSICPSMRLHYYSISPLLAKITPWRQIVSYNRPERYQVKNWSIRPQMLFDSALC